MHLEVDVSGLKCRWKCRIEVPVQEVVQQFEWIRHHSNALQQQKAAVGIDNIVWAGQPQQLNPSATAKININIC